MLTETRIKDNRRGERARRRGWKAPPLDIDKWRHRDLHERLRVHPHAHTHAPPFVRQTYQRIPSCYFCSMNVCSISNSSQFFFVIARGLFLQTAIKLVCIGLVSFFFFFHSHYARYLLLSTRTVRRDREGESSCRSSLKLATSEAIRKKEKEKSKKRKRRKKKQEEQRRQKWSTVNVSDPFAVEKRAWPFEILGFSITFFRVLFGDL